MRIEISREWTVADLQALLQNADGATVVSFERTLKRDQTGSCWCGCGGTTKGKFVPGHDSKFHSLAKQVARGQAVMPTEFVNADAKADFLKWHDREVPAWAAKVAAANAKVKAPAPNTPAMEPVTEGEPEATITKSERLDPDSAEYRALLAEVSMGK
jgi:hypothetical protein